MSPRISLLPGDTPDELDLDLLELGAVSKAADRARIEAARGSLLASADREIAEARDRFLRERRPLREGSRGSLRQVWRWAPVVALAAAALILLRLVIPEPPGVRPMGSLPVDLVVTRGDTIVDPPWRFAAGDELLVTLQSPRDGYLDVWTRQDDGVVSKLVLAKPVREGEPVQLPGAIRLDTYDGEEWLMIRVTDQPSVEPSLQLLEPTTLEPGSAFLLEVTRGP